MNSAASDDRARWTARSAPTLPPDHPPDVTIRRSLEGTLAAALDTLPRITLGGVDGAGDLHAGSEQELRVDALLGVGGMGRVYAATQRSLTRGVAVKVLSDGDPSRRASLLHEARITGRLEHPNIVPVHALGVDARGEPVMVMKRIEGASLRALRQDPAHPGWAPLDARHADRLEAQVAVLQGVCDALSYAHDKRVVHRDVKPENVMVGPFGEVYLLDWGVALDLTAPQGDLSIVGTPAYMAPEMVRGALAEISARTDVFLLGATLHEVLCGAPPHRGETLLEVMQAAEHPRAPSFSAEVPVELAALCAAALSADAELRPASAAAFREGLQSWARHRASVSLSTRTWAALRELQLTEGVEDEAALDRALSCRYGFAQAQRMWPENPDARAGLRATLGALADHALARRDVAGARSLLDEIPGGDVARADALDALDRALREDRARDERARAVQREMDLSAWLRGGPWVFAAMVAITVVFALGVSSLRHGGDDEFVPLVVGDAVMTLVIIGVLRAAHRFATANVVGRRVAAVLVVSSLWVLAYDVFAWRMHWSVALASAQKLLAIAAIHVSCAALGMTALRGVAALALLSAALVAALPGQVYVITPAAFVALTGALWFLARSGRLRSEDALR